MTAESTNAALIARYFTDVTASLRRQRACINVLDMEVAYTRHVYWRKKVYELKPEYVVLPDDAEFDVHCGKDAPYYVHIPRFYSGRKVVYAFQSTSIMLPSIAYGSTLAYQQYVHVNNIFFIKHASCVMGTYFFYPINDIRKSIFGIFAKREP